MMSKQNSKRTTKQNPQLTDGIQGTRKNFLLTVPPQIFTLPDRIAVRLSYKGFTSFVISTGQAHFARRWQPSAAYDIDPILGSTSTVGYAEWAAFYSNYRVNSSTLVARFANTADTPCQGIIIPLNADPGSSPSLAVVNEWQNNPYGVVKLIPSTGAPCVTCQRTMSTEKIYGSKMVWFDDNFASLTNNTPVNNWYWGVGVVTPGTQPSNYTVYVEVDITIDVEFYTRKILTS
jgi:hypothetical protein